jgi:hypothetical protein
MPGRHPTGPPLVRRLQGSRRAKQRMEVILETIAGTTSIVDACQRLGIEQAMLFRLRAQVLQAGIASLEPKPIGRPPKQPSPEQERLAGLKRQLDEQRLRQEVMETELEIARILAPAGESGLKKTNRRTRTKRSASRRIPAGRASSRRRKRAK